jgi:hypothetical protein
MKRVVTAMCVVILLCGVASGQPTPGANYEHLKSFDQLIGNWAFEGPLPDAMPGIGGKDTKVVVRCSWTWILDKSAVEGAWSVEPVGGTKISGKGFTGWDVAGQRMVGGGLNSVGGHGLDTTTFDAATKTWTTKSEGTDGEGKATTATVVLILTDPNTLVWQATEQSGGLAQGPSPKLTFKRVASGKRPAAVQQSDAAEAAAPVKKSEGDAKSEPVKKADAGK